MTRKSKREIERALDDLDGGADDCGVEVVWRDQETGDLRDRDGDLVDQDDLDDDAFCVIVRESVVVRRERAEAENMEILGPAEGENIPDENDAVRVAWGRA